MIGFLFRSEGRRHGGAAPAWALLAVLLACRATVDEQGERPSGDTAPGGDSAPNGDSAADTAADTGADTAGDTGSGGDTALVDADGDGFPAGSDCDDADPDVYPGAEEVCGDGVVNDCGGSVEAAVEACARTATDDQALAIIDIAPDIHDTIRVAGVGDLVHAPGSCGPPDETRSGACTRARSDRRGGGAEGAGGRGPLASGGARAASAGPRRPAARRGSPPRRRAAR